MCSCFCNHAVAALATAESTSGVRRTSPAWSMRHDSVEPPHGLWTERPDRDDLSALAESPTVSSLTFVPPPDTSAAMLVKGCLGRDVACQALQDSRNTLRISTDTVHRHDAVTGRIVDRGLTRSTETARQRGAHRPHVARGSRGPERSATHRAAGEPGRQAASSGDRNGRDDPERAGRGRPKDHHRGA